MKKKAVSLLMVAAMMTTMAAGCGNKAANNAGSDAAADNSTTSDAAADNSTTSDAAAEETAGTEAAAADSEDEPWSGTITVWSPQEDQDTGWLAKECDAFNAAHPNWDITFNYGVCAEGDAKATVTQDVENSADVYMLANDNIPDLVSANALAELGGSYLDYVTTTNSDSITASVTYNDAVVAFPFTSNTWFMYYDKSVFSDDDIKSFDTMLEKGKVSFPLSNSWYIQAFYVANGCTLFGDGTDAAAGVDFSGDKGAGIAGLRDGSVNAIFSGTWDAESVKEALGDNMGVAALPTVNIGGTEGQMKSFIGSKAIGVNPNTENMQVSMALAAYLAGEDAQKDHYDMRNILPTNTNIAISDDEIATAVTKVMTDTSIMQPLVSEMSNYWSPAENMGKALVAGEITADNAAEKTEDMNTTMNTDIAQ